jgi:hypothetical protein
MTTLIIWLLSPIPFLLAGLLWVFSKKINWIESAILSGLGFVIAGLFCVIGTYGMTHDTEIWSGECINATHIPAWLEYYEEAIYRTEHYTETEHYTDSNGHSQTRTVHETRQVFSHWEPRTRHHSDEYIFHDTLGNSKNIDPNRYNDVKSKFGGVEGKRKGDRTTSEHNSRMISGDPNDYYTINKTNHVYPVSEMRSWENKVKASPSVFSFKEVPKNIPVYEYPVTKNHFTSKRIIGSVPIDIYKWDQLCAELGPMKKVNLIIAYFPNHDESIAEWQRAKWIGGKKNDLVICYGGITSEMTETTKVDNSKPAWVKVFGWTEQEIVKVKLEELLLKSTINNDVLPKIKEIVMVDYKIKDWKKFDYLSVELPASVIIWYVIVQIVVCGVWFWFSWVNEHDKSKEEQDLIKISSK